MSSKLPDCLRQSLSEVDYSAVLHWWDSLSPKEQQEFSDVSQFTEHDHAALPEIEGDAHRPEAQPFYEYLVNHELRCVGFVDDAGAASSYKIVSHYVASLGADMRHRKGTVG